MLFSTLVDVHPPTAHLTVAGELDAFSAREVRRRLDQALAAGSVDFTVDASAVTFVDAGGLGTFVRLRNAMTARHGSVRFVAVSDPFIRVCELAGLQRAFGLDLVFEQVRGT